MSEPMNEPCEMTNEQWVKLKEQYVGPCGGCGFDWGTNIHPLIDYIIILRARVAKLDGEVHGLLVEHERLTHELIALRARVAKLEAALRDTRAYVWSFARFNSDERAKRLWEDIDITLNGAPPDLGGLPMENWSVHPEPTTKAYMDDGEPLNEQ
jgi:hypothetical protein